MSLSEKLDAIMSAYVAKAETSQVLFGKLIDVTHEMAKRIEILEKGLVEVTRREHSHPLGLNSYCGPQDRDQG